MLNDKDNQKNLLLAIVLSVSVLLAWQVFYAGPKLKEEQERRQRIQQEQQQQAQPQASRARPRRRRGFAGNGAAAGAQPGAAPSAVPSVPSASREAALADSPRAAIDTPSLRGSIALKGGRIDDLVLGEVPRDGRAHEPQRRAVLAVGCARSPTTPSTAGWRPAAPTQTVPGSDTRLDAPRRAGALTPDHARSRWSGTTARASSSAARSRSTPTTCSPSPTRSRTRARPRVTLYPYCLISRHGTPKTQGFYILHEGPIGVLGDAGLQELTYADLLKEGGTKTFKQTGGWLGITDKYWAAALIPDQKTPYRGHLQRHSRRAKDRYQTDFLLDNGVTVPPGAAAARP